VAGIEDREAILVNLLTQVSYSVVSSNLLGHLPVERIIDELDRPGAVDNCQLSILLSDELWVLLLCVLVSNEG